MRAELGHVSSHARAIGVGARGGRVHLHGHVLAREAPQIVASVRKVRGVMHVQNELIAHSDAERLPVLQGGARRPEATRWPPGPRLLAALAGAGMLAFAARRDSLAAPLATTAGVALLVRSLTNRPVQPSEFESVLDAGSRSERTREAMPARGQTGAAAATAAAVQPESAAFPSEEAKTGVVPRPAPR
jgi:hypothetical protein